MDYSNEWQPYEGDYEKQEYDIRLLDGTVATNCYPHAGYFNSMSGEYDGQCFDENQVAEIRYSEFPKLGINEGCIMVNDSERSEEEDEILYLRKRPPHSLAILSSMVSMIDMPYGMPNFKAPKGTPVEVRTTPKIGRNDKCPCGSGAKFKNCCTP